MGNRKLTLLTALFSMLVGVVGVQAQIWNPRVNENEVRNILNRIETRTDSFRVAAQRRFDNNDRWDNTNRDERIEPYLDAFERATDDLSRSFGDRRVTRNEVVNVLNHGLYIDRFMRNTRMATNVENQWRLIRNDLDQLSTIYRINYNWNQTLPPFPGAPTTGDVLYQPNDAQVRALLTRLETRTNTFSAAAKRRFDNNNRWDNTRQDEQIEPYIDAFENATDELRRSFGDRRVTRNEVMNVMNSGLYIDQFMRRVRMANNVERQWTLVKNDLNQLSNIYRLNYSWNQTLPPFPTDRWGNQANRLDGTYRLNAGLSDNVTTVVNRTISNTSLRDRQRPMLERRLQSPQALAIDVDGNRVTMATNYGAPVTLTADGRTITETNARGRTTRTTVTMSGNTLSIVTDGDRNQDYRVTFTPVGGNRMRVTRSVYLENQNQLITANSVYDRTSQTASWPPIDRRPGWNDGVNTPNYGDFIIPNGTRLTAVLRNRIATDVSYSGDPFTMEVTSPSQYRGAIISGRIAEAERSGRVTGRANLVMDFNSIQYRGRTYNFAAIVDSARETDGDIININNEGTVRDSSQTTRTVTRAGIGAALGALIGAIAGGGEGAAVGAAVGAGAGAGSVLIQGRNDLELEQGTQFTITATGPTNVGYRN